MKIQSLITLKQPLDVYKINMVTGEGENAFYIH